MYKFLQTFTVADYSLDIHQQIALIQYYIKQRISIQTSAELISILLKKDKKPQHHFYIVKEDFINVLKLN